MHAQAKAEAERQIALESRRARAERDTAGLRATLEASWRVWLLTLFRPYFTRGGDEPFAPFHAEFWAWVWALERGTRPPPFIAVWARGAAKSTSAELACAAVGALGTRRYVLYICSTQQRSDDHVQNVATLLESAHIEQVYTALGERRLGKYGAVRGWRRSRLRTASGFTIDAIGLDTAARGIKIDEDRPDLLILDDIDAHDDTPEATEKKIIDLTTGLLPAGSPDAGVVVVQNLIHPTSIVARLANADPEHRVDWLVDRVVSGPHPAIEDLAYAREGARTVLTGGRPTWAGQDLAVCQALVDQIGIDAFLSECQQRVEARPGGMYDAIAFARIERAHLPDLVDIQVWLDPAVTDHDGSDAHGISAGGIDEANRVYLLYAWERRTSPEDSLRRAFLVAYALGASTVGIETDQGGDTWISVAREALRSLTEQGLIPAKWSAPRLVSERAGSVGSKTHRGGQLLAAYQRGGVIHVTGAHPRLEVVLEDIDLAHAPHTTACYTVAEAALRRFPKTKPFDLADSLFWLWHSLTQGGQFAVDSVTHAGVAAAATMPSSPEGIHAWLAQAREAEATMAAREAQWQAEQAQAEAAGTEVPPKPRPGDEDEDEDDEDSFVGSTSYGQANMTDPLSLIRWDRVVR